MAPFSISAALTNAVNISILRRHNVIYLDRGLIILNKQPGLVSQGTHDPLKMVRLWDKVYRVTY